MTLNAEAIFKQANLKSTATRLSVVNVLVNNHFPLTHTELLKQLPSSFDRVTLYRVLDWLLQQHLVHRIAGEDRAWRFQLNAVMDLPKTYTPATLQSAKQLTSRKASSAVLNTHEHAHFECTHCGKIYCLENVEPKLSDSIPASFKVDSIVLNIKGKCGDC
jgi:Fur family transcriptional regulator, ferric uptake regulator